MLIFLANVGRAIYLLKITDSQLESEVSSYTEEDEFCFFWGGEKEEGFNVTLFLSDFVY